MAAAPDDKSQVEQTNNPPDSHPDKQLSGNNKDPKEINILAKDMAKEYRRLVCPYCTSFYTDARTLTCGHMLCFPCLSEIQTASESRLCVTCEVQSIPPVEQLRDLVPNQEVNKAVGEAILRIVTGIGREQLYQVTSENLDPHTGIECNNCHLNDFIGTRYVCGNCRDFNLCAECEATPREGIHPRTHLFIKLKKPVKHQPPKIPVLKKVADEMSKAMDFSSTHHAYVVSETGTKVMKRVVVCDSCHVRGMRGNRYYCGMCADYDLCETCERKCEKIHDKSHVFVKIPNPLNPNMLEGKTLLPSDYLSGSCTLVSDPDFADNDELD